MNRERGTRNGAGLPRGRISQEELAARADLHRNYVSSVERGQRDVGVGALQRMAGALSISLAEFFKPFRDVKR